MCAFAIVYFLHPQPQNIRYFIYSWERDIVKQVRRLTLHHTLVPKGLPFVHSSIPPATDVSILLHLPFVKIHLNSSDLIRCRCTWCDTFGVELSTAFLVGPMAQLRNMFSPHRAIATIVYILLMVRPLSVTILDRVGVIACCECIQL